MEISIGDLAQLGLGGAFAVIMFYVYRTDRTAADDRRAADATRYQEDLKRVIGEQKEQIKLMLDQTDENIRAITSLEGTIRQAGLVDKLADLESRIRQQK